MQMVDQELKVSDNLVPCNNPPSDNSAQSNGSLAPCRTTKIRFLDQLSPEAQQAYHDEQERKKEEKKSKIEEIGESETRIETVEQPSAAALASQTAENTQYNRLHQQQEGGDGGDGVLHNSSNTVSSCQAPVSDTSTSSHAQHNQVHENNLPTIVGIQTRYSEQELIIQSRLYQSENQSISNVGVGNGYQNPVFDMEQGSGEVPSTSAPDTAETQQDGWSRVRERRPKRWSFRRSNSGRFEHNGRVWPNPSLARNGMIHPNPGMEQYHYIQLQQEQKINWTRSFTIEQQLRYGITPTGEPLDVAMLKEIQMHHNLQIDSSQLPQCAIDNISIQNLSIQDHQISSINTNLNEYGGYQVVGAGDSPSITGAGGAAVNGSATLINGGPGVHNVPNGTATGPGLQNNLGTQDENSNHDYSSVPMAGLPMIGALMGMCIGGPIGMLAGVKIGGFSAVMGSILGYTGASVVKEHQDFREYIDGHYEQEPQLYVQSPRDDSLNKRRVSRSLPEVPGQRPIGSAKYMVGPNGYRRPSLVRASSFSEHKNVNIRMNMARAASAERGYRPDHSRLEGGHRKLPTRPFTRMGSFENRDPHVPRRGPLLRNNSNLHRKMSYRQQSGNSGDSFHYNSSTHNQNNPASHHRTFRRYGPQTEVERRAVMALIAREREGQVVPDSYLNSDQRTEGKHGCDRRSRWSNVDKYQENSYLMRQREKPRYQPPRIHNNQNLY